MNDYQQVIATLREAYNRKEAERRDQSGKEVWKVAERQRFLALLQREGKRNLLEIGAGTGTDSLFFNKKIPLENNRWHVQSLILRPKKG